MHITAIILTAITAATTPSQFSMALDQAKAEMSVGVTAMERASPAIQQHDMETACPFLQEAHLHYAAARDILEKARLWYLKNQPEDKQEVEFLVEDRDMVAREVAKVDFILTTGCGGVKAPAA